MTNHKQFGPIVLINPNNMGNYVQATFSREHLGLGYLAAELIKSGYKTQIIDSRILGQTPEEAIKDILKNNPLMVGFSIIAKSAAEWCQQVAFELKKRKPSLHVTMGNYFPSLQPERAFKSMPNVDSIVLFEGDITLLKLVECLAKDRKWEDINGLAIKTKIGIQINPIRPLVQDLDQLPEPIHTANVYNLTEYAIEGSRGCYRRCVFCSIGAFFDQCQGKERWRFRSAKSMAREIQQCIDDNPKIKRFRFVDPDFCGASSPSHLERLEKIVAEFKKIRGEFEFIIDTRTQVVNTVPKSLWIKLRNVGLSEIYLGVESATDKIKKRIGKESSFEDDLQAFKILESVEIRVRYGFMMITPWTEEEDVRANAKALKRLGFPRLDKYFQEMYVVPGTKAVELTSQVAKMWFDNDGKGEYYSYELPVAINNLRILSRYLTINCLAFLKQHQKLHESVRKRFEDEKETVTIFKDKMNDFSYQFFMAVFEQACETKEILKTKEIAEIAVKVTREYQKILDQMEDNFYNRLDK